MTFLARLTAPYAEGLRGIDRRAYLVVAMTLVSVAARMSVYTFLGIYFTEDVGLSLTLVGGAYLLENVLRGVSAPLAGALSDRLGRRAILIASALASAVVLPAFLLVETPLHLFLWAGLLGVGQSGLWPATAALLLDLVPASRRQAVLGLNYTALSIGYTLGVAPAGFLVETGFATLAAASAGGYALIVLVFLLAFRRPLPPTREEGATGGSFLADLWRAPRDPAFVLLAAFGIVFPLGIGLIATVAPLYASQEGLGEGAIGLALAVNGPLLALLSIPVSARLARHGPYRFLVLSAALLAASYVSLILSGGFVALVVASVVFTAGELIFSSALPSAVAALAPRGLRGAYQGAWGFVHSMGFGAAVFVTGILEPSLGWPRTWMAWTLVTLGATAGLAFARPRFRRLADERAAAAASADAPAEDERRNAFPSPLASARMTSTPAAPRAASALLPAGFAILAFGGLLSVLALASAELENTSQATMYATAAFVVGAIGALLAAVGAFRRA